MSKHGKKYQEAASLVEKKAYELTEAVELLLKTSNTKFDASCEMHMHLGIDPKQADQIVRSTVTLPHGTGKELKVVAFVTEDKVKECKAAGATEAGLENLIEKINKGWMDFDIAVAMPEVMKEMGKVAKTLGQKGLMPNPKSGTISPEPTKIIKELKGGKVEFRNDKLSNLHNVFGKVSFGAEKLEENLRAYVKAVQDAKPSGVKGVYVLSATLATSMGPGVPLDVNKALKS